MKARKVDNVLELIGNTPLIKIDGMHANRDVEIYVKLELMNPGGSVKDRIGLAMIEAAEAAGDLVPGKVVLEASSGNTAIGLAMACAVKGYKLAVTMAESASEERKKILRAYGAELILTPGHLATDGAIEEAYRLAREEADKYVLVDQYNNAANWQAHFYGTGQEIYDATEGKVSTVVLTMGTTGTLMGCTRILRELNRAIRVVGVEPFKGHKIQGLKNMKESYPPGIFAPEEPDEIVNVEDELAFDCTRRLAREHGILVGMSSGAALAVALREAERLEKGIVVALLPDGGERYLSTSLFSIGSELPPLSLYNSLTRSVEKVVPVREGKVGVYSCGPSLDGPADIGFARRAIVADLLCRYLDTRGYSVTHVMNIADIDDRTITECLRAGEPLESFAARWEASALGAMEILGVRKPSHVPRASEHVNDMVDVTRKLVEKGFAYEKLRSVYFSIARCKAYGRLSGVDGEAIRGSGKSTEYDYYEKEDPRDFALFKRSSLAELKAGIYWNTPWGSARPSWHVECATMATRYLGQPFDIHTASTNLLFPHGDNEIAVAEALGNKDYARNWLHSELVHADGKPVSRRHGNELTLDELLDEGINGRTIRFWIVATHYRRVLTFSREELAQAQSTLQRLDDFIARLRIFPAGEDHPDFEQALFDARTGYLARMDEDLNVPRALGHVFAFVRQVNRILTEATLSPRQAEEALDFLREVDGTLGVMETLERVESDDIAALVKRRYKARQGGDFAQADALRDEARKLGFELLDGPGGTTWRRVD